MMGFYQRVSKKTDRWSVESNTRAEQKTTWKNKIKPLNSTESEKTEWQITLIIPATPSIQSRTTRYSVDVPSCADQRRRLLPVVKTSELWATIRQQFKEYSWTSRRHVDDVGRRQATASASLTSAAAAADRDSSSQLTEVLPAWRRQVVRRQKAR